ncbi:MAG: endonuclease III [Candidatus Kerfeldbacteria bacterium RIFCSPHIGHO2_12_FULL_48_17]|uniref:Endonuclease III n=1 Tax=Candidatus Kerfeldbacteria bacterium RIFCSPHIGHO2_12_FULL_48_17 TaxID=1798542 RepID=A0A1G2B1M8_9BACT|nr:MAG: endonuclease III [Candidatus Kerfeldbacteria bacterium RIFCSPHIGHO2_12_FULL_48_17]
MPKKCKKILSTRAGRAARARQLLAALQKLYSQPRMALRFNNTWEMLVAVMLSAQTTDKQVNVVTAHLFRKYLRLADYASAQPSGLARDIRRIGLWRGKARNIVATARIVQAKHGGRVPQTMDELTALPGVGRKTANIILSNAYGKNEGIAVDTHVTRLSRLFGLTRAADPVKIEQDLVRVVPRREWGNITHRLILYGREYCPARCRHADCPLRRFIV